MGVWWSGTPYLDNPIFHPQTALFYAHFIPSGGVDNFPPLSPCKCRRRFFTPPPVGAEHLNSRVLHTIHRAYYYDDESINKYEM